MERRRRWARLFTLLLAAVMFFSVFCVETAEAGKRKRNTPAPVTTPAVSEDENTPYAAAQRLADYLFAHGELPEWFLTKREAEARGWDSRYNYVSDVAPGMSIGGDYFGNYEERLPKVKGRKYYEADCWYNGGRRNAYRIIYTPDDGIHVWYTEDHYNSFIELTPSEFAEGP